MEERTCRTRRLEHHLLLTTCGYHLDLDRATSEHPRAARTSSSTKKLALTHKKLKWTMIMVILPEVVFAGAVLELKMALDDHLVMYERRSSLHFKVWRVNVGFWVHALHHYCTGPGLAKRIGANNSPPSMYTKSTTSSSKTSNLNLAWPNFRDPSQCPHPCGHEEPDLEWTLTRSYFSNMGGITFDSRAITTFDLLRSVDPPRFPANNRTSAMTVMRANHLTEEVIIDKSKVNMLL